MTPQEQKVMEQALEALEECRRDPRLKYEHPTYDKTITAIKEALSSPNGEAQQPQDVVRGLLRNEQVEPMAEIARLYDVIKDLKYDIEFLSLSKVSDTPLMDALNFFTADERMELWKKHDLSDSEISVITKAVFEKLIAHPPVPIATLTQQELLTAQPKEQEPVALDVTIDGDDAKLLASMLESGLDGEVTAIRLLMGSGHSGYGLYVSDNDYPDAGSTLLVNTTPPHSFWEDVAGERSQKIAELEDELRLLKKQTQAEQESAPVAKVVSTSEHQAIIQWLDKPMPSDSRLFTHQQNLSCKSTQARLAASWGYVKAEPLTSSMVSTAARVLNDRQADACNVDRDDQWKIYGQDFIEDAEAMLRAAHGIGSETTLVKE